MICLCSHLFCRGFIFYLCYLYLFKYTGIQLYVHITSWSCCLTVTWWVPLVEQELLTLRITFVFVLPFLVLNKTSNPDFLLEVMCSHLNPKQIRGICSLDRMVVGFITTYAISAYHPSVVSLNPTQARCTQYNIMW